jgi:hypothetical protein
VHTWADVIYVQPDPDDLSRELCAQLCLMPNVEFDATGLDIIYGTTCLRDGYSNYTKTTTVSRHLVHWYAGPTGGRAGAGTGAADAGAAGGRREREHKCEANRLSDAVHITPANTGYAGSCEHICLNPVFKAPAAKRGVEFGGADCQERGYTRFVQQEKTLGCARGGRDAMRARRPSVAGGASSPAPSRAARCACRRVARPAAQPNGVHIHASAPPARGHQLERDGRRRSPSA